MEYIHTVTEIIEELNDSIINKKPFSLIRFGDGGLKLIKRYHKDKSLFSISRREGIPLSFFKELIDGWAKYANEANFIDSPEVYISDGIFKNRDKMTDQTKTLMHDWKAIYKSAGLTNMRFCNPEIGYLLFAENSSINILDTIRNRDICCVTNFYGIKKVLSPYVKSVTVKLIPEFFGNFYDVCYESLMYEINQEANKYDLWLIGAGELGRLFSGRIKECGGRSLDIGKVFDVLVNKKINKRMRKIAKFSDDHKLLFVIGEECDTWK